MKNLTVENQCSIGYRVELDKKSRWYNQSKSGAMALLPFEFESRKSPLVARRNAFKFVNIKGRPIKAYDLNVFLVDLTTRNEYLIFNGQTPTDDVMKNLELECQLYYLQGYEFEWTLLSDPQGKGYRAIDQPCYSLTPAHQNTV